MARSPNEERLKMKRAFKVGKTLAKEIDKRQLNDIYDSETEDVDFTKVIHPLGHYMNDRKQMIEEMFSIIKGEKLKRMLPTVLKSHTLEELKADCLVHLLGMSKKRINAILEGRDICSSSDTESENESDQDKSNLEKVHAVEDDLLDISVSKKEMDSLTDKSNRESEKSKSKSKEQKLVPLWSIVISDDETDNIRIKKESDKSSNKLRKTAVNRIKPKTRPRKKQKTRKEHLDAVENGLDELVRQVENDTSGKTDQGKTLLEILELEMRARAIRALLKSTPDAQEPVPVSILNLNPPKVDQSKTNETVDESIAKAIDKTLKDVEDGSEHEDVELIEVPNADLCVTIDDDDDDDDTEAEKSNEKEKSEAEEVEEESVKNPTSTIKEKCDEENEANESDPEIIIDITNLEDLEDEIDTVSESNIVGNANKQNTNNDPTWSERWAKSKNVKEVIKNSKICANIRKRMRFARMKKQKQLEEEKDKTSNTETAPVDFSTVDESSVAAYNLIKKMDKSKDETNQSENDANRPADEIEQSTCTDQSPNANNSEADNANAEQTDEELEPGQIRDTPTPTKSNIREEEND